MTRPIDHLDKLREAVRGVSVTSVSPFDPETLALDEAAARRNLELLAASGVTAIIPSGNTGEFHSLTADEIARMVRLTVEGVSRDQAVIVGVGGGLSAAIELAELAEQAGATGIMIHEPAHTFASTEGLELYYRAIATGVSIGVTLYKRSARVPDRLIRTLAGECENVVAVKYAVNDLVGYIDLVEAVGDDAVCACGTAERWALPFAIAGTTGFTSGIGNFAPDAVTDYWRMLKSAPTAPETRRRWRDFAAIEEMRARDGAALNVPVIKRAMELLGHVAGPPRPPLSPLTDALEDELRGLLAPLTGAALPCG